MSVLFISDLVGFTRKADNGFQALAQYDTQALRGDGNGQIDSSDAIWDSLLLWIDSNGNAQTDIGELFTLESFQIKSILTEYKESERKDAAGNSLPYWSWVIIDDSSSGPNRRKIVDIFFKVYD
ncbi:hypothetical protein [Halioxenophilus sp. WMMB6]|uniref:hypothetical protein n=1 Tax=Halioxenophilus sp. WMMB6 TaxID=3073815 RepID=UPI00295F1E2D|nr:hypothetical protein [Halioxenophilus sp. WMMB6]